MAREIEIILTRDPTEWFTRAKRVAFTKGITLEGDASAGTFSGLGFSGSYRLEGQTFTVRIEEKPSLIPWRTVEKAIAKFFG